MLKTLLLYSHDLLIYGGHHVLAVLACGAVLDGEAAGDEIVLDVHHHDGGLGLDDLGYPAVPAVDELLHAHGPVPGGVEDHEEVADLLTVEGVWFS